ncbi:MAG: TonB-dependent siderophore receptor [Paracoccus denitrificans]|uniref:TonB-dependent siderophore receptor n=1 Tax=Paracoccus denitrificans TaxID=266 RepID=A0A533IBR9_PARDE|nr:MAG: TonB-dependent siderophore receptor [Paracoccus denitrificans]
MANKRCISVVRTTVTGLLLATTCWPAFAQDVAADPDTIVLDTLVLTAEEQVKQALGASVITEEDMEKQPVKNDVSEVVRKMPGVNLTGNSASGQRGNQRQIDIRGMGPENVLILIDGKPVTSRNAIRMGRQGERNTRGDSNWVPPELIERIEVLRGPSAARYGSGSAGGVVNIITKRPDTMTGTVSMHFDVPQSDKEGVTRRLNAMIAGPINEQFSYRVYGSLNKTDGDDPDINDGLAAGTEGVRNKDFGALLSWEPDDSNRVDLDFTYSRQGNIYAGEEGSGGGVIEDLTDDDDNVVYIPIGEETNTTRRQVLSLTHTGEYSFGASESYLQWEKTRDNRVCEGLSGSGEGDLQLCADTDGDGESDDIAYIGTEYETISAKSEWDFYSQIGGREVTYTVGAEVRREEIDTSIPSTITNADDRDEFQTADSKRQTIWGVYTEANILATDRLTLTPGLRYDHSDKFGSNMSPSLNATYDFNDEWSMKVGVARAFKAPNLFQLNPNYYYNTMGRGCPAGYNGPCRIKGNPDLEPEHSVNKEIGVAYAGANSINASLTYFHNDYKNRIAADVIDGAVDPETGGSIFEWRNTPEAVVSGLEGNFSTPIADAFTFNANATYMIESKDKRTGNPLSLVPDYTINAELDWQAQDDLLVTLSMTHYGPIPTIVRTLSTNVDAVDEDLIVRGGYTLFNLGAKWDLNEASYVNAGVTNLFDKEIKRTDEGSETFNEPGRAFYVGLSRTF